MSRWSVAGSLPLLALAAVLLPSARVTAPAEVSLSIGQARLGNIFSRSEPVVLPVATTADRVRWTVTDFYGVEVAAGEVGSSGGRADIVINSQKLGYFELDLQAHGADSGIASARTTFAVVPATTVARHELPFGVMTHFAQGWDVDVTPLIERAGIRHVRDEQYWARVEQQSGRYSFPARFTSYMSALANHGLEPLIVLSFANALYDDGLTPFSDQARAAYARYSQAVLDRYGPQMRAVEVWNEYNGSFCEGPCRDDRPAYYTRMLERAYQAVKQSRPDVAVAGGAVVKIPLPYLEAVFEAGGLAFMDAVVVHPYGSPPETVARELAELQALIRQYRRGRLPIWVTEIGQGGTSAVARRDAARYLVSMFSALLSAGVERIYWYLLRDYREFEGMGLLHGPDSELGRYVPTPAYAAYANLIDQLGGATFVRREPSDPRTHIYRFDRGDAEVRVAWTTEPPARLRLEADQTLTMIDIMGGETTLVPNAGAADLVVDADPLYIRGSVRRIHESRRDEFIADSVRDYSDQQGKAGWSYGYYDGDGESQGDGRGLGAYTDDDFEPLERVTDQWSHKWGDHRFRWLSIGPRNAHPSRMADRPVWAVRRWVSKVGGRVHVSGRIAIDNEKSDGVTARMLLDGRVVFAAELGGAERPKMTSYELEVELANGSRLDFAIGPGPKGNIDFDSSTFTARITRDRP